MKDIDICGLGNPIVDVLMPCAPVDLSSLSLDRGSMRLVEEYSLPAGKEHVTSGGSVANSVIANAQLGASTAYIGCVGNDSYGVHFTKDCAALGVIYDTPPVSGQPTGKCSVYVSEDGERTMQTCMGAFTSLTKEHIDEDIISRSRWLFIEGYAVASGAEAQKAILRAMEYARRHDCKVAFTLSADWLVEKYRPFIREVVKRSDLVFGNEREAQALTKTNSIEQAWKAVKDINRNAVVTLGAEGAYVSFEGQEGKVEPVLCTPVDSTGAGDMFAGAFLYGLNGGLSPLKSGKCAAYLASRVVAKYGARLDSDVKELWNSYLKRMKRQVAIVAW